MKAPAISVLSALITLTVGTVAATANMIVESGFESYPGSFFATPGSPITSGGWTFSNHAGVDSIGVNPGKHARLESTGSPLHDPTVAQTVAGFVIGATYTLEWDWGLRVDLQSGTGRSFGVFLDSQVFPNALFISEYLGELYQHSSVSFVATAATHTIIFAGELDGRTNGLPGSDTDVSYNLDNVSLTGGPASGVPDTAGTTGLLVIALAAIGAASRRRAVSGGV